MLKCEVLGTLSNSSQYSEFQDLAYKLKELTNRLLESNERIKTKWQELTKAVDDPIDLKLKKLKLNLKSKYGRAMSRAHELLRKRKKAEVRDHIQNQILKLVIKNNWRPGHSISKIREINKSCNSKYVESGFNKARNKSFKKFSKNQFWDPLIFEQEKDTNKALSTIARDLENLKKLQNIKKVGDMSKNIKPKDNSYKIGWKSAKEKAIVIASINAVKGDLSINE